MLSINTLIVKKIQWWESIQDLISNSMMIRVWVSSHACSDNLGATVRDLSWNWHLANQINEHIALDFSLDLFGVNVAENKFCILCPMEFCTVLRSAFGFLHLTRCHIYILVINFFNEIPCIPNWLICSVAFWKRGSLKNKLIWYLVVDKIRYKNDNSIIST